MPKTKDYSIFKFRNDNRYDGVNQKHVDYLVECIKHKNMLEFNPIIVNQDFEIINGQHRLKAAEKLGVDIYYAVRDDITHADILSLNGAKSWGMKDYFNFFVKNKYPEYLKLEEFMKENSLLLVPAFRLFMGQTTDAYRTFYSGKFVFPKDQNYGDCIKVANQTINLLKKLEGVQHYLNTAKFMNSLIKFASHGDFNRERWFCNVERLSNRFKPCCGMRDYYQLFANIHDWRSHQKIDVNLL